MQGLGVTGLTGEAGFTTTERRWARPTFDVNGLWSGYQGEGSKTVLPGKAEDAERLNDVIEAYKGRFRQQSVGLIVRTACVSF